MTAAVLVLIMLLKRLDDACNEDASKMRTSDITHPRIPLIGQFITEQLNNTTVQGQCGMDNEKVVTFIELEF